VPKVPILLPHPAPKESRINRSLVEAVSDLDGVTFNNLYDAYPEFDVDVKEEDERSTSVAVVGAGIAGLTAAHVMSENGLDVRVFDKSRGPGGRMSTRRHEALECDHGAQFFTVREDSFRSAVTRWRENGLVAKWDGSLVRLAEGTAIPQNDSKERLVAVPRMSALCRNIAESLNVQFHTAVTTVERGQGGWELKDSGANELGAFDKVVITAPPVQTVSLLEFVPDLRSQVASVEMLPCWAVMVLFRAPLDIGWDGAFVSGSPLSWICRNNSKPHRSEEECWVLHGSPEWSDAHTDEQPDFVAETLLGSFFDVTGCGSSGPLSKLVHRWRYARAAQSLGVDYLYDSNVGIGVCGDWCRGDRVEDAFMSGLALGRRIAQG
jgi:predicted NAD/FAD-dependent oxidoreductase